MIGFELTNDNDVFAAALEKGTISVIISRVNLDTRNYVSLDFGGYDIESNAYPRWYEKNLHLGDKIIVKVKEIVENSPAIIQENNQEEYFDHIPNIGIELSLKGETISAVIAKGSIHLIATVVSNGVGNEVDLDFVAGNRTESQEKPIKYWYRNTLQLGDEFTIEIKEIKENTIPLETE
ncbi:MAG: hypothetical protein Q4A09_00695 [Capnocytophaga felis]|nr:hypothetical protein [Capnocytophaga felis]